MSDSSKDPFDDFTKSSDAEDVVLSDASSEDLMDYSRGRYWSKNEDRIVCFNCGGNGHTKISCPKTAPCFYCGSHDHLSPTCNTGTCFNCARPGHQRGDCFRVRSGYACSRCGLNGHGHGICPDIWRSYRYDEKAQLNEQVYRWCYNCGIRGHWGDDCKKSRKIGLRAHSAFVSEGTLYDQKYMGSALTPVFDSKPEKPSKKSKSSSSPKMAPPSPSLTRPAPKYSGGYDQN